MGDKKYSFYHLQSRYIEFVYVENTFIIVRRKSHFSFVKSVFLIKL